MAPQVLLHWRVERAPSHSQEFMLSDSVGPVMLIVVANRIKPDMAAPHFKLQRAVGGKWQDEQESSGTLLSGSASVHYIRLDKPTGIPRRLEVITRAKELSAEVDALIANGHSEGLFDVVYHSIEELGPDVVRKLPALQDGLERSLSGALGHPSSRTPSQAVLLTICGIWSAHVHPPSCPFDAGAPCPNDTFICNIIDVDYDAKASPTTGPLTVPANVARLFLANRLRYERTSREALERLALHGGVTWTELQDRIDRVNALSEVLMQISNSAKPPDAP